METAVLVILAINVVISQLILVVAIIRMAVKKLTVEGQSDQI